MNPKSAIQKGKELENWICDRLITTGLDVRATRTPGSGNGIRKGDIMNDLDLCIEAKNCKNFRSDWAKQVKRESLGMQVPIVAWHPPHVPLNETVAIISWAFLEELLQARKEPVSKAPDRAEAWAIKNLVESAKKVIKILEQ